MRLRLIRHATLVIEYGGHKLLVDPMLSEVGAQPPIANTANLRPNPLVPLPITVAEILEGVELVLVTHTHRDHWDMVASDLVPKNLPLFGQKEDEETFRSQGFTDVRPVGESANWNGIKVTRTEGQHGTGEIGKKMAPVSGFVLQAKGQPSVYIAGDTIWCPEVEDALQTFEPAVAVVNAGAARFLEGDPITMNGDDVVHVCQAAPHTQVVAVHMEAINHCGLGRAELALQLLAAHVIQQAAIPQDGDWVDRGSR
jgi:L-ascorbate metabolism protein UlaG (beta-lactamase superfamily)